MESKVEDDDGRDMDGEDGKFVWAGGVDIIVRL